MSIENRFIKYAQIDTQSDPKSTTNPSTLKQLNLLNLLLSELKDLNIEAMLEDGVVYGFIPKNTNKEAYKIGFIAHVDTSPDAPGDNVNPRIIKNYDGSEIKLNDFYQMDPLAFPDLKRVTGDDIIVTDGNSLLGADDKAGVAEIMELASYLVSHPEVEHGDIYLSFTPDEEIGRGTDHFNLERFKADFAYTLDGGEVGIAAYENFNAATAKLTFTGRSIHPGSAKGKMVNSILLAMEFHNLLPTFLNPSYTEKYEGFNHATEISGGVEETKLEYIIRNHDQKLFLDQKKDFERARDFLNDKYHYEAVKLEIKDSYYNMYELLKDKLYIVDLAKKATEAAGVTFASEAIRGGTDGAMLTYKGLPTPNLGTGGYQFHGRLEFVSINQMKKAVEILINIAKLSLK